VDNNGIIKIYKQSDINTISVLAKKRRKFHWEIFKWKLQSNSRENWNRRSANSLWNSC
jgi:hypothetical protein